jgi:serine/threonine-protein kinase HipA
MNGEKVGVWRQMPGQGQEFLYAESWLSSPAARPISLSLPLRPSQEPYRAGVEAFFENLLPDNRQIRERIQRRFHADSLGAFDLLREIGRDCVGALQLLPEGDAPGNIRQITGNPLTADGVAQLLDRSLGSAFAREDNIKDEFRISLAGAQEKTALLWHEGRWHRPMGTTPTTHILKLPIGIGQQGIDLSTSVENEWLCAQIARAYGLEVAACRMETFGEYKTLVVERFDRRPAPDGTWLVRLPLEDLCQATATPPGRKYESDGGPGIRPIMELLLGSERAAQDRRDFMRTLLVFWMLAAIDGHAKNFSIFLLPTGAYRLAPRYDILSAYPILGHGRGKLAPEKIRMAMAVEGKNRHYHWHGIHARHWIETAKRHGLEDMQMIMTDLVARTPEVIQQVQNLLPAGFPAPIADTVLAGIRARADQLTTEFRAYPHAVI